MIHQTDMHEPSIGTLIKDLTDETRTLFQQEIDLAKTELSEKTARIGRNVGYLAVGGFVAYAGLLALVAAASIGLVVLFNRGMDITIAVWLGPLVIGIVAAALGYVFIQKAISTLKRESFVPQKTLDSLRENKEWLKDQMTIENRMT